LSADLAAAGAVPDEPPPAAPRLSPPARVLIAKPGLDGHDRGAKVVARALRDAGMEVIYTGIRQTPAMIAEAALQEDVEAIGLSILSGAHLSVVPRVLEELRARGNGDVILWLGGIIPAEDLPALKALGVEAVFGPGTTLQATVDFVRTAVAARRQRLVSGAP
jgi:methylmalonyl-CoA mutase C-terminal domain/subunit